MLWWFSMSRNKQHDRRRLVIRQIAGMVAGAVAGGLLGYFGKCAGGG